MALEKFVVCPEEKIMFGNVKYEYSEEAQEILGMSGAMISSGKQSPEGEKIYWNACVFNDNGIQIWHGDLNLTRSEKALQDLADRIGTIHVTPEQPFRFEGLDHGRKSRGDWIVTFYPLRKD